MTPERVLFAFVIVLALTLNAGFTVGEFTDPEQHNSYELFAAIVVSLVATVMKFGDRSPLGSTMLATSLVADVQLIAAAVCWGYYVSLDPVLSPGRTATVISLAVGALLANIVSVVLLLIEVANVRR